MSDRRGGMRATIRQMQTRAAKQVPRIARIVSSELPPARTCQWIEHDPQEDMTMCGAPSVRGFSYCQEHFQRCYQPASERPLYPYKQSGAVDFGGKGRIAPKVTP